jgi:hypothetical protein
LDDGDDALEFFGGEFTGAGELVIDGVSSVSYRLLRSTSAFLQTKLEYRRPTPLILVKAYMTFCLPALVRVGLVEVAELKRTIDVGVEKTQLSSNQHSCPKNRVIQPTMNWKFALSPGTSDILAVVGLSRYLSIPLRGYFEPDGGVQGGSNGTENDFSGAENVTCGLVRALEIVARPKEPKAASARHSIDGARQI